MGYYELRSGRPEVADGREEKEIRCYDLLDELQIPYEQMDHPRADTMEVCLELDKYLAPTVICKNLFLCNRQKTNFYLLLIKHDKKFKTKEISAQIGSARLSFGEDAYMEEFLDIKPGAVSILGLMNDQDNHVRLLVDEDLLKEETIGVHPCVNTSVLRLKTKDLFTTFLTAVHHDMTTVHLVGED
ncbi:MAG TPA: prolyl-tRNA synthetase associated domain-containing protein [Clostridiales bacterium]|nr:prolyl-tRNA synthetase associated domain-containing protein [Clostridiales bacterium]